jgi:hypothetical protein
MHFCIIVPIYKKGEKTDSSDDREVSSLPPICRILYNIFLPVLTSYVDEVIGVHQYGLWHNRSTTDQIFCICQMLAKKKKKWKYNGTVHQERV